MKINSTHKEEFYKLNVVKEPILDFFATELEYYKDDKNRILGILLKDKSDEDFSYVILSQDEDLAYKAIDVIISLDSIESARSELLFKLNESIEKEIFEQSLYKMEKEISVEKPSLIITDINEEVKKYFKKNPEKLYNIEPRQFEELIASLMQDLGFKVELTKATRDGGRDIIAQLKNSVTDFLAYVECKRYAAERKIGVGLIREVSGVHYLNKPSKSIIVTTSFFTKDAVEEAKKMENQMDLKDFNSIKNWLNKY